MRILLIFLALISAPAVAQTSQPVPVRYEYTYAVAMLTCYRLQVTPAAKVPPILATLKSRFRLSDNEFNLLINYCLLYDQGYNRKVPR